MIRVRDYHLTDREACLAILEGNTPDYYLPHEEADFAVFLDRLRCRYLVLEDETGIVACGGYHIEEDRETVKLDWGMVNRLRHRKGLGRLLLLARLHHLLDEVRATRVALNTSQHSRGFFEREGFVVVSITPGGYGPGLHRHEMQLDLTDENRRVIRQRWDEQRRLWDIKEE